MMPPAMQQRQPSLSGRTRAVPSSAQVPSASRCRPDPVAGPTSPLMASSGAPLLGNGASSAAKRPLQTPPRAMKQLINAPDTVVVEALEGLVRSNANLQRLDGFPDIKVIFDKHHDKKNVAIISGGGSGHEPAHAGYVGSGMLSAAVCGEVFASPSAEAVLAGIRTVTGPAGCLVILKNYTGDRLHFGLAVEQAKAEGLKVDMVLVGDDVAIEEPSMAGRRGLAGVSLVHKAAGAAAAKGASLEEVAAVANRVASAAGTLGVALRPCTLPGKEPSGRLGENEIEIGLGIHGEPGTGKMGTQPADKLVEQMVQTITKSKHFGALKKDERVVLLVNNLGGTPPLEMSLVTRSALAALAKHGAKVERLYAGCLVTSLDMAGVSLTLLRVDAAGGDELLQLLDHPVEASGWPFKGLVNPDYDRPVPIPSGPKDADEVHTATRPKQLSENGKILEKAIEAAAKALLEKTAYLDELDGKAGDGDCGSTLALGANAALADYKEKYDLNRPAIAMGQLGLSIRRSIGGTSGALYDVLFTAVARALKEGKSDTDPRAWAAGFKAGADAVSKYGGATAGARTMLDAMLPAAEAAQQAADQGADAKVVARKAADAAHKGAEATKTMGKAKAGRASYIPEEQLTSVPDPGAAAVSVWLKAIADVLEEARVPVSANA